MRISLVLSVFSCLIIVSPLVAQSESIDLNGTWNFTPVGGSSMTIEVPGYYVWETDPPFKFDFGDVEIGPGRIVLGFREAVYERTFDIPGTMLNKRLFLQFDAVNFVADITINDQLIGSHTLGYLPFEFDITSFVSIPSIANVLQVEIKYEDDRFMNTENDLIIPTGVYDEYWYLGIVGDVRLTARQSVYIDDIQIETSVQTGTIHHTLSVVNPDDTEHTFYTESTVMQDGIPVKNLGIELHTIDPEDTLIIHDTDSWQDPVLWSPEHPHLYTLRTEIIENAILVDQKEVHFGFREFRIEGDHYLLNEHRITLRGDNVIIPVQHQFWQYLYPEAENWPDIIDTLKSLNFNSLCYLGGPAPPWMLDLSDEMGILTIPQSCIISLGSMEKKSNAYVKNCRTWIREWIKRDRNHPSVIAWSLEEEMYTYNERLTINQIFSLGQAAAASDTTRPVYYNGERDFIPESDVNSKYYMLGFPTGWATQGNSIFTDLGGYLDEFIPTVYGGFETYRDVITEAERHRRQSLKIRSARILGYDDIRPFRADWAWHPNPLYHELYGGIHGSTSDDVEFLRRSLNPIGAYDKQYYAFKTFPIPPIYDEGESFSRPYIIFNEDISDTEVEIRYHVEMDNRIYGPDTTRLNIPLGESVETSLSFNAPYSPVDSSFRVYVSTWKQDALQYEERYAFVTRNVGKGPPAPAQNVEASCEGTDVRISWDPVLSNVDGNQTTIDHYVLYKSTDLFSSPEWTDSVQIYIQNDYLDAGGAVFGDTLRNRMYCVRAVDIEGLSAQRSDTVGLHSVHLQTTTHTDFNHIAFPFVQPDIEDAQDLMEAIPGCNSIARWDPVSQGYEQYIPSIQSTIFPIETGRTYFVNATKEQMYVFSGKTRFTTIDLITTTGTNFNDMMLPLQRSDLKKASALIDEIPNCNSVAQWLPSMQGFQQYIPAIPVTDFDIYAGCPYLINVSADGSWPEMERQDFRMPSPGKNTGSTTSAPHLAWISNLPRAEGSQSFIAFLSHRPEEQLTADTPGCMFADGYLTVQCSAFPSSWSIGDTLEILLSKGGIESAHFICTLTDGPADRAQPYPSGAEADTQIVSEPSVRIYPNPFNSEARILLQLRSDQFVNVAVLDIKGRIVNTLYEGEKSAGNLMFQWDGTTTYGNPVPTGTYILSVTTGVGRIQKKLCLLR